MGSGGQIWNAHPLWIQSCSCLRSLPLSRACVLSCFSCVWLFEILWTVAHQAPLSLEFSSQEYQMCSRATLSIHPTLFPSASVFGVCLSTAARQVGHQYHLSRSHIYAVWCCAVLSHVQLFATPWTVAHICVNIWHLFFSFWLISFCIIGSRFIHLIRTESNVFLSMAE